MNTSWKLRVDRLESRDVPAAITAIFQNGGLAIAGTSDADTITVSQSNVISITGVQIRDGSAMVNSIAAGRVKIVVIQGYNGSDTIDCSAMACPVRVYGGLGQDSIIGGRGNDQLYGNDDNDSISGGPGNDLIYGGWGNDDLSGDFGNDVMYGDNGTGGSYGGNDSINGGRGWDWLFGEGGNDTVNGGPVYLGEFDFAWGGYGNDAFYNIQRIGPTGPFVSPTLGLRATRGGVQDATILEAVIW